MSISNHFKQKFQLGCMDMDTTIRARHNMTRPARNKVLQVHSKQQMIRQESNKNPA